MKFAEDQLGMADKALNIKEQMDRCKRLISEISSEIAEDRDGYHWARHVRMVRFHNKNGDVAKAASADARLAELEFQTVPHVEALHDDSERVEPFST